ncbi:MAG: DUF5107 domain-containing protein, partial [Lachnospiraceae bacterium]|nr:DUF5107 domain-containing protein [Lachnospiraceae bacterium]
MSSVKIWEEQVTIPTYETGEPEKNPVFLDRRVYQGSSGKVYPYPTTESVSDVKTDRIYHAVFLENEYLKVMVLPELGGRIQRATDKTNGYDFVYYNHVIKPALVGLTGPGISGGIEFNWPQHHRPTTFLPVDHHIEENPDGSSSLLIGDVDQMYGTKVLMKITLYPGKAYIEITGQLYNRTPLPQTFLWWANPAVSVNDNTQSVFPPDVHNVYDHGKRAVSRFPIATGEYYKHDYSEGVDISRYRNIPVPTSYMAERSEYDFVGGYDYGVGAGLLHVADHHVSPGKKQWTWGCGDFGKAWDRNLTDDDGPYIELMTGMYCDNQPDFAWLAPFEEKVFKQYFMPYKAVGQVRNASIHAALNVEPAADGSSLDICVYATQEYGSAQILVTENGRELCRKETFLSPEAVFHEVMPAAFRDFNSVCVRVLAQGETLVSYQASEQGIPELAEPAAEPASPEDTRTSEELFLTAQHLEQYRHATWLPDPYYLEALKRDPGDSRANNAYGLLLLRRGAFAEAEPYFRAAIGRLTGNGMFNNPYDGEPFYNLGLSLFYQERFDEAYDAFYKAVWTSPQQEMGYYFLAAIACRRKDYAAALDLIGKALVKNTHNIKARGLKAVILRYLGMEEAAIALLEENLAVDAFDYVSLFEQAMRDPSVFTVLHQRTRGFHENYLQTARDYAESGFYEEAIRVLEACPEQKTILLYYRGFYEAKCGRRAGALKAFEAAEKGDPSYLFPNKPEDIQVFYTAIAENPDGAKAPYYLGCLFYDKLQRREAIRLWEQSAGRDPQFPTVFRNLALAYYNVEGNPGKAEEAMERAFSLNERDVRVFLERDQLLKKLGRSFQERLAEFEKHKDLIRGRDDLFIEYITLVHLSGDPAGALQLITSGRFHPWEGGEGKITTQYVWTLLRLARSQMRSGNMEEAEKLLRRALVYPENLGEGKLEGTRDNHLYYHLGLVLRSLGREQEAQACFATAVTGTDEPAGAMYYNDQPADMILYQGLSYLQLGRIKEAKSRFYRLIDYGERHLS